MRSSSAWAISLALVAGACSSAPPKPAPAPATVVTEMPAAATSKPTTPRSAPDAPGITVAAVGDIMLGTDYPKNVLPDDDGVGFLAAVTPALAAADIAFGNLEGPLVDGGEAVKQCKPDSTGCYAFRSPTRYAQHLRHAGFDVVSLANNHMADFGEEGRDATMRALDGAGIRHSGREGDVASWEVRGRRVALIAFAPNVGAHQLNDLPRARARVAELAGGHDIVIVSMHAGAEGQGAEVLPFEREYFHGEDRGDVVAFARAMVDAGADLVLGHGPHIVRPLELYSDRLIAYSLGNFATYYGISVAEARGLAPILEVRVDDSGAFVEGRIRSTIQIRPGGPVFDPERRVLDFIRELTHEAFPDGLLAIGDDGTLARRPGRS
jgi:poly-gamma-glutamate capsule biosynthesis protein CapA/YwtB (metallophosphatase superfamily)